MSKKLLCKESKSQHSAFLPKDYKRITVSQVCDRIVLSNVSYIYLMEHKCHETIRKRRLTSTRG